MRYNNTHGTAMQRCKASPYASAHASFQLRITHLVYLRNLSKVMVCKFPTNNLCYKQNLYFRPLSSSICQGKHKSSAYISVAGRYILGKNWKHSQIPECIVIVKTNKSTVLNKCVTYYKPGLLFTKYGPKRIYPQE